MAFFACEGRCFRTEDRYRQLARRAGVLSRPLLADSVAKVENRTTLKISRKLIFGLLGRCVAFQRHYGDPWSILDETIWSLTSPLVKRISGSKKFRSSPQKGFCNKIGTYRTCRAKLTMSLDRGKADLALGRIMDATGCVFESMRERKQKDRPKAVFVFSIVIRSGRECSDLATAIRHVADTSEAKDHHRPGRRFGDGSYSLGREENRATDIVVVKIGESHMAEREQRWRADWPLIELGTLDVEACVQLVTIDEEAKSAFEILPIEVKSAIRQAVDVRDGKKVINIRNSDST